MNINDAYETRFIKSDDLKGRSHTVYIDHCEMEEVGMADDPESKPCLYFRDKKKGLVLNKTNAEALKAEYGPETDEWEGKPVILFTMQVTYKGKSMPGLRVRFPEHVEPAPDEQQQYEGDQEEPPF